MTIKFILLINKQGTVRLAKWFISFPPAEQAALQLEIVRKCLARGPTQCSFFEHSALKIIYRKYASLFVIVAVDDNENELGVLELIHLFINSMDNYFDDVCELDILFSLDRVHMILDEMVVNGDIVETNQKFILEPVQEIDKRAKKEGLSPLDFAETISEGISKFFED